MRFGAPRSASPSPERKFRGYSRRRSAFGLFAESSEEEDESSDAESVSSSSTDSFCYASESEVPPSPPKPKRLSHTLEEQHYIEDAVASIRLRVKHHDPYEEWERKARTDALQIARQEHAQRRSQQRKDRQKASLEESKRRADLHAAQLAEVQTRLAALNVQRQTEEKKLTEAWKERDRRIWASIESTIKLEEEKVRVKLEAERKKREEEESKRRAEEEKRKQEEERKRQEAEKKSKEELEKRKEKERQEEELRQAEKARAEREKAEEEGRKALGLTTPLEEWTRARISLKVLKAGPMKTVKGDKTLKSMWSAARRQITPKIGQLTNDPQSILRVSSQIVSIIKPSPPHPQPVYYALLSSLAKTIFLQAETEVTAEKRSAIPLAQVAVNLLGELQDFEEIFWAKLCQRVGGWSVPIVVPSTDADGTPFDEAQRTKVLGYRSTDESLADYSARITGIMRVYFHIICAPVASPMGRMMSLPRLWTYLSRIVSDRQLLVTAVAPQVIHAALEVGGAEALQYWGHQWVKLLELLYEGTTVGIQGQSDRLIGGKTAEGTAARVRVQLEVERLMNAT